MKGLYTVLLIGTLLLGGCSANQYYVNGGSGDPKTVKLVIDNGFTNTAEIHVWLVHYGNARLLRVVRTQNDEVTIRVDRPLREYVLMLTVYGEGPWYSQRMDNIGPGACAKLQIGQMVMYSALNPCTFGKQPG